MGAALTESELKQIEIVMARAMLELKLLDPDSWSIRVERVFKLINESEI